MTHKVRKKQLKNINKKYKNLAGVVAVATLMSTAALPGIPANIAQASANPNNMSATTSQQIGNTNDSGMKLNFTSSVVVPAATTSKSIGQVNPNVQPDPNIKAPVTTSRSIRQANPNVQPDPNIKAPVTTSRSIRQANPNVQPDPNIKAPVTTSKSIRQANPNVQPDPNIKAPVTTSKSTEQANPNVQSDPNLKNATATSSKTAPNNIPTNYKEVLDIKATAYAPGPHDNDQWGNKTYIGSQVRPGIIAVDPDVIPLGSRVYIQYPDGHGEYAVAEDTGGAIKGNRVDIAKWTVNEAEDFGIQNVKVFVVNTPEKA